VSLVRPEACGRRRKWAGESTARTPLRRTRPRNAARKGSRKRRPAERFRRLPRTAYQRGL